MKKFFKRLLSSLVVVSLVFTTFFSGIASAFDKNNTAYMVGNAHIDAAWLWPVPETIQEVNTTFSKAVDLMNENSDYKFSQSAAQYYKWAQEYYPDLFNQIKEKVNNGQWEIVGGQEIEPDLNITSGESLVRQSLYAQTYFKKEFGREATVGWVPDVFGFNYQVPQILKKSGMDYFVTTKLNWNDTNPFPYQLFKWQGLDGSQLVTYKPIRDYVNIYNKNDINESLVQPASLGIPNSMGLYGQGDHGGGPNQGNIDQYRSFNADTSMPSVKMAGAQEYFDSIKGLTDVLPVWNNEMYLEYHRGTYTTQAAMKNYNRTSEITAEEAEKLSSFASLLGTENYPKDKITEAWEKINLNQFHDILPGSSIHQVYEDAWDDSEVALNYLNGASKNALSGIASRANTLGSGTPVVVFNPLSWERTGLVETSVQFDSVPGSISVFDSDGVQRPVQITGVNGNLVNFIFEANNVPSMGYKVFKVYSGSVQSSDTGLKVDKETNTIENKYYIVQVDSKTGNVSRIYDKINQKEVLEAGKEGNVLQVYNDTPREYDAWNMDSDDFSASVAPTEINTPASIEVVEQGPVETVIRVVKNWSQSSFTQDITLYSDTNRIDVRMSADWHESHKALKVAFPLTVNPDKATYEIAYGAVDRSTTRDNSFDAARFEVPGQKWADMSKDGYGVSILNNNKYGWDALNNTLRLTLLRAPKDPDPNADMGYHEFTYSIYPHSGDWKDANTVEKGYELNYPMLSTVTTTHNGDLPKIESFMSIDQPNVVISVVKQAEGNSDDMIIRMYESQGKENTTAKITFPSKIVAASEVNLVEDEIGKANFESRKLTTTLGKYEIKTFRIKLEKSSYKDTKPVSTPVELSSAYNLDGMSFDSNRKDGNLDGFGGTFSANLMPDEIVSEDITYNIGPKADGKDNLVQAKGQTINLNKGSYNYVYVLGTKAGAGKSGGTFTVNYTDGSKGERYLAPKDWTAIIGGWNKAAVKDTIGYVLSHNHNPNGDNLAKDNYLYVYKIGLEPGKTVESITLPDAPAVKIAAMTLVKGISLPGEDIQEPSAVTNLTATTDSKMYADKVVLNWNPSSDNIAVDHYNVYRSTSSDFADEVLAGQTKDTNFTDNVSGGPKVYYYRVCAEDLQGNVGQDSNYASAAAGPNIAIGMPVKSDKYVSNEPDFKAVDGSVLNNSKWCATGAEPHWLYVDLGEKTPIRSFVVKHASEGGEQAGYNTKDFKIQVSDDAKNWTDVATVTGNTAGVTYHPVENVSARYARLYITDATNISDTAARIYEFEIWGKDPGTVPQKAPEITGISPDNGQVTLAFSPVLHSTSYEIRYGTASDKLDNVIKDVTSTQYTINGLTNNTTYYFTVLPVNPYGYGPASVELSTAPHAEKINVDVDISKYFDIDAASYEANKGDGNFDLSGWAYVADQLPNTITSDGITFTLGSMADGASNAVRAAGQTIDLPLTAAANLKFLGAATNGNAVGNFTVNFEDGTTKNVQVGVTDWCSGSGAFGEKTVASTDHRHYYGQDTGAVPKIFSYNVFLGNLKRVKSITLPNENRIKIFAMALENCSENPVIQPDPEPLTNVTKVDLTGYFNQDGFSPDSNIGDGAYDFPNDLTRTTATYPSEAVNVNPVVERVPYQLGSVENGGKNSLYFDGQTINLTEGQYSSIRFLGSATNGTQTGTIKINYSDGTSKDVSVKQMDWTPSSAVGETIAEIANHRHMSDRNSNKYNNEYKPTYIYAYNLLPDPEKVVVSITLPANGNMHMMALTLVGK